jgi:hypothetical protein
MQIDALIVLPIGYRKSNIVEQQYKISIVTTRPFSLPYK